LHTDCCDFSQPPDPPSLEESPPELTSQVDAFRVF
jgi:hypothetical protein